MNGNAQKLIKYMDGASKRFIIPVYQRNYDWKMEHCKQLYDDLVKVIRQNRKSHFFGSIVSVQSETGTMEEFLIIDGQQRLTTISLLLLAIYHLLSAGKMVSQDRQLTDKILKKYLIDEYEPEEKRIKLKPIKNDQKAFGILFDKDMKKKDLCEKAGISPASVTKMGRNGHVTTEILLKICTALDCGVEDIMEIVPDEK